MVCALLVIPFGVRIEFLTDPFHPGNMIYLGLWSYPITVLWSSRRRAARAYPPHHRHHGVR